MSKGETPPVKERLEMPVATQKTDSGLTPGLLRVLNKQVNSPLGDNSGPEYHERKYPIQQKLGH